MTTYAWPNTRSFTPQLAELRVVDSLQRVHESPLSGYTQTQSMPGARWGWGFTFPDQTEADRQALEGYLLRLSGREHRVQLWDHKRPTPRGSTLLNGVTLSAAAAQFATALQLSGCRASANPLLGGSFEIDVEADGLAEPWQRFSEGSTGALSRALDTFGATDGAKSQFLLAFSLGVASSDRHGVFQTGVPVAAMASQSVTASCTVAATAGTRVAINIAWQTAAGAYISGADIGGAVVANDAVQSLTVTGVCPATAATAAVYIYQHTGNGGACSMYLDAACLGVGAAAPSYPAAATLLAGDWLGLAGGQLVRVVSDAQADDLGRMTVEVRHMLRQAATSGSAVTLDRPTALYMRAESGLIMPRQPGNAEPGLAVDFVEAFA